MRERMVIMEVIEQKARTPPYRLRNRRREVLAWTARLDTTIRNGRSGNIDCVWKEIRTEKVLDIRYGMHDLAYWELIHIGMDHIDLR